MGLLLELGRPIEWFLGRKQCRILFALLGMSMLRIRRQTGVGDA